MNSRKKFREFKDWCPQPSTPITTKLKHYATPIAAVATATLVLSVSFFVLYSSLMSNPSVPIVPLIDAPSSTAPTLLWNFSTDGGVVFGGGVFTPIVENDVVYLASGSYVYALNASDGSEFWNNSMAGGFGGVAVANGEVFVGTLYNVVAMDAKTGSEIWSDGLYGFANDYNTPVVAGGVVYGSGNVVGMFAWNAKTGNGIWSYTGGGDVGNALGMWSSPVVANGRVYIAAGEGIYVLKANNGVELWNSTIAQFWGASPVVANGVIYAGSSDGNVYAFNANSGDKIWNYTTGPSMFQYGVDGLAYSDSQDGSLAGVLYAYSQDGLYALNATTGEKLWNQTVPVNSYPFNPPNPVVADNVVYVGSGGGNLYAFDAANGAELWNYTIESASNTTLSTPSLVNGVVYIGSDDGNVYALRVSPASSPSPARYPILYVAIGIAVVGIIVATTVVLVAKKGTEGRERKWVCVSG